LHGLKVGEVTEVALVFDRKADRIQAEVEYQVQVDRIAGAAAVEGVPLGAVAADMVKRGFRATLQAPSLISSGKVVAIEVVPDAAAAELGRDGDTFIMPSADAGGFDSITRSASELLGKINRIDFDGIGRSLAGSVKGIDDIVNGPEFRKTLASLQATMADLQDFSHKLDVDASPAMARLPEIAKQLDTALAQINKLAVSVNSAYGSDSRFSRDIDRLLPQLNDTVRSFRALAYLLSRHPEALIKGRTNTGKE